MVHAANNMLGLTLTNGWIITEQVSKSATGGNFSVGYKAVGPNGRKAFVKAMDYTAAIVNARRMGVAIADALKNVTQDYTFERDFCLRCKDLSLKRVAHAIDHGQHTVDPNDILGTVDYLIFELADGDIRSCLDAQTEFSKVFALRSLHHIASALFHLHSANMAHQDLKPSNSLYFGTEGTKLTDFGRSWSEDILSPYDALDYAGDPHYCPPEIFLNGTPIDLKTRKFGCDMYQFGSMIVFYFTRISFNALLMSHLSRSGRKTHWTGSFGQFLPYLQAAFADAIDEFSSQVPAKFRSDLTQMVQQLCEPDPSRRGHPSDRKGLQFSMQRYVSKLNCLAYQAEIELMRGLN